MKENKRDLLIKTFSDKKYANDFLFNGAMFFRSAVQFAQLENDSRQDKTEGQETYMVNTKFLDNDGKFKLKLHNPCKKVLNGTFQFVGTLTNDSVEEYEKLVFDKENDCLIYSITYIQNNIAFEDSDITKFGEHMIVISNTQEFKERVFKYFAKNKIKYYSGAVEYYALREHNLHTLFRKHESYKGEHEFRFIIANPETETKLIKLGDISDIATYVKSQDLCEYLSKL